MLRRALDSGETCAGHEFTLTPIATLPAAPAPIIIDITATPLTGQVTGMHLLLELTDARMRQRITRETELLSRVDGNRLMVRQLAHEIRNPLGGLRGAAQLLERELAEPGLKEYTNIIINEADRLRSLVDTMLGPAGPPRKQAISVHELCEHVYQLLRSEAANDVDIDRDYDPSVPDGRFDRNEIIQALLNIGRNSLQALARARTRRAAHAHASPISISDPPRHRLVVCVQIEDDGPGVPEDLHKTLFYPLVTGKAEGTGLGLSVAQDMVARHGGIIEFESRPGHTVFSILLPLEDAA